MDEINLCMLAPEFFPVWGGVGTYIIELLKYLPENVNVHVVTLKRKIFNIKESGLGAKSAESVVGRPLQIHYLSTADETFFYNLRFQLACLKNIPKLTKEYKFDIIHSHMSHMPDVFLALFRQSRIPTVTTVHSTIKMQKNMMVTSGFGEMEWSEANTLLFFPIIDFLQRNYVKRIPYYIAVSEVTRLALMTDLNVQAGRISLIHNGVDTCLFHPPTAKELEKKYSMPTVVYVGRIMARKGIHVLLGAVPRILKIFPNARFLFVGGGNVAFYEELAKRLRLPDRNVSFVGHLGYFDRLKILREATVFVNPSFFENCSMSILEAMSSGAAVVASDVGGNPEIIKSGQNGILVPPHNSHVLADSIISLLGDEQINRKICLEARKSVEASFSSKKCAQETYYVYRKILGRSR
jgi:glycosyltransferase involved in cell wall biosynthesis